jgi:hypothetical protein
MYTPVVLLALFQLSAAVIPAMSWHQNYTTALQQAAAVQRPLAVFIGSGTAGWQSISPAGQLDAEARRLLADHYICLYVDTTESSGKQLAASFGVTQGPALILSDKTRQYQAYRQAGTMQPTQLVQVLQRYQAYEFPQPSPGPNSPSPPESAPVWDSGIPCRT